MKYKTIADAVNDGWVLISSVYPTKYRYYYRDGEQKCEDTLLSIPAMNCFYKKNPNAGKNNGGYATMGEIIDTLVIEKNGVKIELTGDEAMTVYKLIKPAGY